MKIYIFLFTALFFMTSSCSDSKKWDAEEAVKTIFSPDEQHFRRLEIGMSRTEFDAAYTGDAIYGNEMEVIDSLSAAEGVYCETAFRFKGDYLSEISVQIIIDTEEKKNELLEAIRKKLMDDFGEGILEDVQHYWRAEGGMITTDVFLTDHSAAPTTKADHPYVILLFYTAGTAIS